MFVISTVYSCDMSGGMYPPEITVTQFPKGGANVHVHQSVRRNPSRRPATNRTAHPSGPTARRPPANPRSHPTKSDRIRHSKRHHPRANRPNSTKSDRFRHSIRPTPQSHPPSTNRHHPPPCRPHHDLRRRKPRPPSFHPLRMETPIRFHAGTQSSSPGNPPRFRCKAAPPPAPVHPGRPR